MKLIIFPGAADPLTTYKDVYTLLENEAKERGLSEFILITFPGHYSHDSNSLFTLNGGLSIINEAIIELEKRKEEYIVLCRSLGCDPFIEYLKAYPLDLKYLKKVILWGPSDYYTWCDVLINNFEKSTIVCANKGFRFDPKLMNEIYPFDHSISRLTKDYPFNIYITSGELDNDYYPEKFRQLLIRINKNPKIFLQERIIGVGHAVTKYNKEYFDLIF